MDEPDVTLVQLENRRDPSPNERAVLERLVEFSSASVELRRQARHVEVWGRCNCGCASVGLRVAAQCVTLDERGIRQVTAYADAPGGPNVEVTLHVVDGALNELEIWTGEYGVAVHPDAATLRFEDEWLRLDNG